MEQYIPIKISKLLPFQTLDFDIYIHLLTKNKYIKYIHRHEPIEDHILQKLKGKGLDVLFIKLDDLEHYKKFLSQSLSLKLKESSLSNEQRISMVKSEAIQLIDNIENISAGDGANVHQWTQNCFEITSTLIEAISEKPLQGIFSHFSAHNHQQSLFTSHSLQTCSMSVVFGLLLGIHDCKELTELALGGLFHDVSLKTANANLQEKYFSSKDLSIGEKLQIQKHTQESAEAVKTILGPNIVTNEIDRIIREHHVSTSINAYPCNMSLAELSTLTRIVAIADQLSLLALKEDQISFPSMVSTLLQTHRQSTYKELDTVLLEHIHVALTKRWGMDEK